MSLAKLLVAARDSPLSRAQVEEVTTLYPQIEFLPIYVKTHGDLDQTTSLRYLGKTDFFTREVDRLVLQGKCRIAVHSAKDLPDPLPEGLQVITYTPCIDSSDSLVMRKGESLQEVKRVATSSLHREEGVKAILPEAIFVDLRGTIEERLQKVFSKEVDAVVVAEAAIIRLKLTDIHRIRLTHQTAPRQGELAIVGRVDDPELVRLFRRPKVLYLGLDPSRYRTKKEIVHYPVIEIVAKPLKPYPWKSYTHFLFTSRSAAKIFPKELLQGKVVIAIGKATAELLPHLLLAPYPTQEGVVELLRQLSLKEASLFWPRSSISRNVVTRYLQEKKIRYTLCDLYETKVCELKLAHPLDEIEEIIFTSPSTVEGFLKIFKRFPANKRLVPIGPITARAIRRRKRYD